MELIRELKTARVKPVWDGQISEHVFCGRKVYVYHVELTKAFFTDYKYLFSPPFDSLVGIKHTDNDSALAWWITSEDPNSGIYNKWIYVPRCCARSIDKILTSHKEKYIWEMIESIKWWKMVMKSDGKIMFPPACKEAKAGTPIYKDGAQIGTVVDFGRFRFPDGTVRVNIFGAETVTEIYTGEEKPTEEHYNPAMEDFEKFHGHKYKTEPIEDHAPEANKQGRELRLIKATKGSGRKIDLSTTASTRHGGL